MKKKAPGIDNITNLQLKYSTNKIVVQIMRIFNYCSTNTHFPRVWKIAKIIPIPKPGKDPLFPQNYRPISLLIAIFEMLEKIIAKKIRNYLAANNFINEAQFGFLPGRCTIRQFRQILYYSKLAHVCCTIIANINKNKHSGVLLLDIEKAFDTVSFSERI